MKIRAKISLRTIVLLFIIILLVFSTCYPADPPLRIGIWDQGKWNVNAWGD